MSCSGNPIRKRQKMSSMAEPLAQEAVKDASEEVKALQSYCFSCGSESVALEPNLRRRKGRLRLMRHRCTECRKFTGDTYVETTSGVYVVYKIDPKVYAHRDSEHIQKSESTTVVNKDAAFLKTQGSSAEQSDDVMAESSHAPGRIKHICEEKSTDDVAPHPLRIKIARGRIVESSFSLELQKAQVTSCAAIGSSEQEKEEGEVQQLTNSRSVPENERTLIAGKTAKAANSSRLATTSITTKVLLQSIPAVERKSPIAGMIAEEKHESHENNEPAAVVMNTGKAITSSAEEEDASKGTAVTPESVELNEVTASEEIPKRRMGCGRRRRPLTMRKQTGGKMSRCRSPSTEAESTEESGRVDVSNKLMEVEPAVCDSDVGVCASKVRKKSDVVRDGDIYVEADRRLTCSGGAAGGVAVENLKGNVEGREQEISPLKDQRLSNTVCAPTSKPETADFKRSSPPTHCMSSQTSDETLAEYVLEEWTKKSAFSFDGKDMYGVLRRLKMACVMLQMQKNEMEKLHKKNEFMNELFVSARNVIDDLKKTFLSDLSRIRGDVSSLGSAFRLYHLDLKRACDTCALKAEEDTRRFELVAAKYEEDKRMLKEQLEAKEQEVNLCRSIIDGKTRDLLVADRDVHLANERVANIQKKLEDKLFVATNTKCTSCSVFDKYRDVLTTQIADKTTALANATEMLNEVRVKLGKQERAARILTKENEKTRFERDAWMSDSKRLENEVKYLRAQLAALSNDGNAISLYAVSTPSDNSGSGGRLMNDSRPLKGASEVRDSPTTSSSTSHVQSPVIAEKSAAISGGIGAVSPNMCPPPSEAPLFFTKWNTSKANTTTKDSRLEVSQNARRSPTSKVSANKDILWRDRVDEESSLSGRSRGPLIRTIRDSGGMRHARSQVAMKRKDESRNEHIKRRILERGIRDRSKTVDNERMIQRRSQRIDRVSVINKGKVHETSQVTRIDDMRSREDKLGDTKRSLEIEAEHIRDSCEYLESGGKNSPSQIAACADVFRLSAPPKPPSPEFSSKSGECRHKRKSEVVQSDGGMKKNAMCAGEERRETIAVTRRTKSPIEVSSTCEEMSRKGVEQFTREDISAAVGDGQVTPRSFSPTSLPPRCSRSPSFCCRSGCRDDRSPSRESSIERRRDLFTADLALRAKIKAGEDMHSWRGGHRDPLPCSAISETNIFAYLNDPFCSRQLETDQRIPPLNRCVSFSYALLF
uniref:Uncharacterized protein n=1 Tax=Parascaris univalens TaxID=6257 RepID=A0A915AFD4_PARUN